MSAIRVITDPICALKLEDTINERPAIIYLRTGMTIRVVGPSLFENMIEISDGRMRYAVFDCDLADRSEQSERLRIR